MPHELSARILAPSLNWAKKPAALMADMCLPLDEYENWLAGAEHQPTTPFSATYTA
jgi:hypothetical protein